MSFGTGKTSSRLTGIVLHTTADDRAGAGTPPRNSNGEDFIAAKLREALSGYVGQRFDPDTAESLRDRLIETLPGRYAGAKVDVKQDAADPTRVKVKIAVPVSPYIAGMYAVPANQGNRYLGGGWLCDRPSRTRPGAGVCGAPETRHVSLGFRAYLPGRQPR